MAAVDEYISFSEDIIDDSESKSSKSDQSLSSLTSSLKSEHISSSSICVPNSINKKRANDETSFNRKKKQIRGIWSKTLEIQNEHKKKLNEITFLQSVKCLDLLLRKSKNSNDHNTQSSDDFLEHLPHEENQINPNASEQNKKDIQKILKSFPLNVCLECFENKSNIDDLCRFIGWRK
jgi:hypothetical protein